MEDGRSRSNVVALSQKYSLNKFATEESSEHWMLLESRFLLKSIEVLQAVINFVL